MDYSVLFFSIVAAFIGGGFLMLLGKLRFHKDNREQNSSSLSSSSSLTLSSVPLSSLSRPAQTYHVFPSFRGEDVRRDFFSHIQMEFQRNGITLFIDNKIKRGEPIGPELLRAIRASKMAIILLSRSYASSEWCLDELVEIMKCREEEGKTVIPIFYGVDPSDVENLAGDFGKVFRETCAGRTEEKIKRWKHALVEVATNAGYHSTNWDNEASMIGQMAKDISEELKNSTLSRYFDGLVGMRAYLVKLEPLLGLCSVAGSAYNKLPDSSQLSDFMENVKAKYTRPWSRTIFTAHDQKVVWAGGINSISRARDFSPNDVEALQIFCVHVFRQKLPPDSSSPPWLDGPGISRWLSRIDFVKPILASDSRVLRMELLTEVVEKLRSSSEDIISRMLRWSISDEDKGLVVHKACVHDREIKILEEHLADKSLSLDHGFRLRLVATFLVLYIEAEHFYTRRATDLLLHFRMTIIASSQKEKDREKNVGKRRRLLSKM
ncbi:probable disease resistance protein RPP1 [Raphanus sativus]|uniref:Probable disease resistance protein RPP1 n=1 Tax=Raphanus sativus TaxID=3726 RepID=A0A9W3C6F4_RAPSA|nr:probable disease resistance protein RPP1 [Raphanus sativus]